MSLNNTTDTLSLSIDAGQTFFAATTYQSAWGASDNGYSLAWINQSWQESSVASSTPGMMSVAIQTPTSTVEEIGDIASGTVEATSTPEVANNESTSTLEIIDDEVTTISEITDNQNTQNQQSVNNEIVYSDQIIINEILPNPSGLDNDDEWIELYNRGVFPVDLTGWQLADSTTRRFAIVPTDYPNAQIDAFGYFVVYRKKSGIALNNTGDSVRLFQPDGSLLEQVDYSDSADDNWAYAKNGGGWFWTLEPTPGYQNVIKSSAESYQCPGPRIVYVTKTVDAPVDSAATSSPDEFNPDDYQGLKINEFVPNPVGSDDAEWIELFNNSSSTLNLSGLSLDDDEGGSKPYFLPASSTMPALTYLVVKKEDSALALNNSSDAVRLLGPDNQILQAVAYQGVKESWSYNYDSVNDEWFWSASSTPGLVNVASLSLADDSNNLSFNPKATVADQDIWLTISEIKNLDKGAEVQTVGAVMSLPGALGKNMFYITEPDLSAGIQVYAASTAIPELKLGDIVSLHGKISQIQGEKRINLLKDSQIEIIDRANLSQPELIAIDGLNDDLVGNLIHVSGELVDKKSSNYYLDDGTGEIRIYLKESTGIAKPDVEEGYLIEVQGILSLTNSGYRLLPRFLEDINVGQIMGEVEEVNLSDEIIKMDKSNKKEDKVIKYSAYGGGSLMAILLSLLVKLKILNK